MTVISLYPPSSVDADERKIGFYIPIDPGDPDSHKVKKYVMPLEHGDVETFLSFYSSLQELFTLQGLTDSTVEHLAQKTRITQLLLIGKAYNIFQFAYKPPTTVTATNPSDPSQVSSATAATLASHLASYTTAMDTLRGRFLPPSTGSDIKTDLQRMRKPTDMPVVDFFSRVERLNSYVLYCPGTHRPFDDSELSALFQDA